MAGDDAQDDSQKTEEPSQKRLDDAREKGQIIFSREVNNMMILGSLCAIIMGVFPYIMPQFMIKFTPFIARPEDFTQGNGGTWLAIRHILYEMGLLLLIPLALTTIAALAAGFMQTRFNVSSERITPKFEKISPLKGLKRMFSLRSVIELIKGIVKITVVGWVAYASVEAHLPRIAALASYDMNAMMDLLYRMSIRISVAIALVTIVIALLDYFYQRFEYLKNLRMTKQEVKDEYRQQEGDPHVKSKLRQIRMERVRKNMLANVPKADVIITNPTHYAIALRYDPSTMSAPVVVAKGVDKVAARIRKIADEHKILLYRNPPLARALYDHAEIDKEIPMEHYQAVAKIIGYVFRLKGKKLKK
ncbi:MAG: flagellar biosynthesis protein FlhB [Alphaproteobacteria bacterium]|nr:MAG: flagellar biosynthesis protein FlhB [Alphaproteobacteria bacterium]TAF12931.1 MAG: flagellar biosynthesis protein FlhB [Alphaproteobacteria bacterium]TAF39044.1 MAG: flagellar biosynthesis protein FlhB [Alphaproteobacteria bacterium]TAF76674.1 MAG: flagellar biosynthesis protein FlhB [Alphaproteobacteria bacterium]